MIVFAILVLCVGFGASSVGGAPLNVQGYGALGNGQTDDTDALQRALDTGSEIFIPAGTYRISRALILTSHKRVYGTGASSLIKQTARDKDIFFARGNSARRPPEMITDITVEKLGFEGQGGNSPAHALKALSVQRVKFRQNRGDKISLLYVGVYFPDVNDPDEAYSHISRDNQLSSQIEVTDNVGLGTARSGVDIFYTNNATVSGNRLEHLGFGVTWWGGNADPDSDGRLGNPRWVKNLTITRNHVHHMGDPQGQIDPHDGGGIWGAMGENITVTDNYVDECGDVGLDAEGSDNVSFSRNTVKNIRNYPLAVFFFSKNVVFTENRVTQDSSWGNYLYYNSNPTQEPNEISSRLENNHLEFIGTRGWGQLIKSSSQDLVVKNNRLVNTILSLTANNAGHVEITGNTLQLTRSTDTTSTNHVIHLGGNHGSRVLIKNNVIESTVAQKPNTYGIYVEQDDYNSEVTSILEGNTVWRPFCHAIVVKGASENLGQVMRFRIHNNTVGGVLKDESQTGRSDTTVQGNKDFYGRPVEMGESLDAGDLNRDGKVDARDLQLLSNMATSQHNLDFCRGDLNGDGRLDQEDVKELACRIAHGWELGKRGRCLP